MGRRAQRSSTIAALAAALITAAACSPDPGVTTESVDSTVDADLSPSTDPALPGAADLPSLSTPDPDTLTGTLDNGLRYMIRDNDRPGGKAELRLAIDVGSVLEDEEQLGGAHFLEHMLFNGTERFPKNELIDELRAFGAGFGADINARTGYDDTVYMLTVPNDDEVVETGLDIFEEWLSFATIDPADVDDERGIVLDEWRARSQTADGRIALAFADHVLDGTPYDDRSPIGGREAIESIGADHETKPDESTAVLDLPSTYDDWLMSIGKKERHEVRRKRRRFEAEFGDITVVRESADAVPEFCNFGSYREIHG